MRLGVLKERQHETRYGEHREQSCADPRVTPKRNRNRCENAAPNQLSEEHSVRNASVHM
jgi:hypothetical protein